MSVEGAAQRRAAREKELGSLERVWQSRVGTGPLCIAETIKHGAGTRTLVERGLEVAYKHWRDVGWEAYPTYHRWYERFKVYEGADIEAARAVSLFETGFDSARGWPNNYVNFNKSILIQDKQQTAR